jgi:hypothetical protein
VEIPIFMRLALTETPRQLTPAHLRIVFDRDALAAPEPVDDPADEAAPPWGLVAAIAACIAVGLIVDGLALLALARRMPYPNQQGLDTTTPAGKALFGMLGVFAEFERSMIRERVMAGLARAKAQGTTLGRKPVAAEVDPKCDCRTAGPRQDDESLN